MKAALFEAVRRARAEQRAVVLATLLPDGVQHLLDPADAATPTALPAAVRQAAARAAARDQSATVELSAEDGGGRWFLQPWNPPLRLILVGAVHIAQPLSRMAALCDFAVVVVDPRAAFATEERFPGVARKGEWPDVAIAALRPDRRTAIVTLTHDPKLDDPALDAALRSPAFYVGCLGSGKTHRARIGRLQRRGFSEADAARLRGPVGLRIGARSPAEIAVSILAEIIQTLRPDPVAAPAPSAAP